MRRLLVTLSLVVATVAALGGAAQASTGELTCEDDGETLAPLASLFRDAVAELGPAHAAVVTVNLNVDAGAELRCRGDLGDDPRCWSRSPADAPRHEGSTDRAPSDPFLVPSPPALPAPDVVIAPIDSQSEDARDGFQRRVDRPPRSVR